MSSPWVVHKFGGTSLANAERYRQVAAIMRAQEGGKKAVIVSAMHKVTDALIELVDLAKMRDDAYFARADALKAQHVAVVEDLLPLEQQQLFFDVLESDFKDIKEVLRGVYLSRTYSDRTLELIAGHGELWSAQLLNAYLNATGIAASWLDARTLLTVEPCDTSVSVDWERSKSQAADVGRKLVILAREMGLDLELNDIRIESLVPESLRRGSVEEFLERLPRHDQAMTDVLIQARGRDEVLHYVGVVNPEGQCSVELKGYPRSHAFAGTSGSDNIVAFKTQRYNTQSLIVQGPGAGPDVTAGGVFADLLRLASYLGGAA